MNEHESQEQMEQTVVLEPLTDGENVRSNVPDDTDMDDTQEFDLEEIMREFGGGTKTAAEESTETADEPETETVKETAEETTEETVQAEESAPVTSDTIRLDVLQIQTAEKEVAGAEHIDDVPETKPEAFSGQWEPEYEQPMGEYVPPQPIQFRPRSRIRELKRQIVAGPERIYYELAEKGLGKLQCAIFFSAITVILCAVSSVLFYMGKVPEERLKLMVFGQFFVMLLSALLGCHELIEGVADIFKKRFTLNTMLVITLLVCAVDGVLGLQQQRIPCCAAFSLQMTLSLWSAYHRRHTEMGQMDVLRKAVQLDAAQISTDYEQGRKGILRCEGELEDFMNHYQQPSTPEKVTCWYALVVTLLSLGIGVATYLMRVSVEDAVSVTAVCLLAAAPATFFITHSRPMAILQKRLHSVGTVLCGWQGVRALQGKAVFPVEYSDLFPVGSARMNGVKFFGSRQTDEVVAYCTALVVANNSGLAPLFTQVLDSRNGYHYDAANLCCYDGGIGGEVEGEQVLVGSMSFLKNMGVQIPAGMRVNQAVCVAIEGELCGLFALNYENSRAASVGLATLASGRGAKPIFVTDDFLLCAGFIQNRFGIKSRRMCFVEPARRAELRAKKPDEGQPAVMLVTRENLASYAYGVVGAKALRSAQIVGTMVHMTAGILGLVAMVVLLMLGRLDLLTPVNMFVYQLVWMIPGLLISEWTRVL